MGYTFDMINVHISVSAYKGFRGVLVLKGRSGAGKGEK